MMTQHLFVSCTSDRAANDNRTGSTAMTTQSGSTNTQVMVLGPYNADEMRLPGRDRLVRPDDRLGLKGGGRHDVIEARSAIDFAALPPPRLSPQEWLAD